MVALGASEENPRTDARGGGLRELFICVRVSKIGCCGLPQGEELRGNWKGQRSITVPFAIDQEVRRRGRKQRKGRKGNEGEGRGGSESNI